MPCGLTEISVPSLVGEVKTPDAQGLRQKPYSLASKTDQVQSYVATCSQGLVQLPFHGYVPI